MREVARTCLLAFDALGHMFPSWGAQGCTKGAYGSLTRWIICLHEASEGFLDRLHLFVCAHMCTLARATFSHHRVHVSVDLVCAHFKCAHPFADLVEFASQPFTNSRMSFRVIGSSGVFSITSPLSLPYISSSSAGSTVCHVRCLDWCGVHQFRSYSAYFMSYAS